MATPRSTLGLSERCRMHYLHSQSINTFEPIKNINESFFPRAYNANSKCALTHSKYPRKEKKGGNVLLRVESFTALIPFTSYMLFDVKYGFPSTVFAFVLCY